MSDSKVSAEIPIRKPSLAKRIHLPRLSGKTSAAWLVVCFGLTAILIPMALRLPRWIEFEIVLAIWWAIWLAVLTRLLYAGQLVADDHQMREPRSWFSWDRPKQKTDPGSSWWNGFFWGSFWLDGEALLIIVGLVLLAGLVWFLIEVGIPLVLFLLYFLTRGMLAQVVNDRHRCLGRLGLALFRSFLWSSVYTAPLAGVVWFVHYVHQKSQLGV